MADTLEIFGRVYTNVSGVKATSSGGSVLTYAVEELAIIAQPLAATATAEDTVYFRVGATGRSLNYQWAYSTDSGTTWRELLISNWPTAATPTLEVSATAARNGFLYRCVITDANGDTITSDAAELIYAPPTLAIIAQPLDTTAVSGNTVYFRVGATGSGLSYQWQYSTDSGTTWRELLISNWPSAATPTLEFEATTSRSGNLYRCVITDANSNTVTSDAAELTTIST